MQKWPKIEIRIDIEFIQQSDGIATLKKKNTITKTVMDFTSHRHRRKIRLGTFVVHPISPKVRRMCLFLQ